MKNPASTHVSLPGEFSSIFRLRSFMCVMLLVITVTAGTQSAQAQEQMIVLPEAREGVDYEVQVATAGTSPFSWSVLEGSLPPGLELKVNGKLQGKPTTNNQMPYRFKVRVTDSSNPTRTNEQWLSVAVLPPLSIIAPAGQKVSAPTPTPTPTPAPTPFILTSSTADEETIALARSFSSAPNHPTFQADTDPSNIVVLRAIITSTVGARLKSTAPDVNATDFEVGDYCAMHTIVWKPLAENKSEPDRTIWSLFRAKQKSSTEVEWVPVINQKDKAVFDTRIMGGKRVVVLLANLNTPATWDVKYKVDINRKIPVPIQHVMDLLPSITGGGGPGTTKDIWGARMMLIRYTASSMVVKLNGVTAGPGGRPVEQSKEQSKEFDNEGKYHWDVSVGLPVKSVKELSFKSEGNQVVAEAKEKQSVYGFLNLYPWAVDLKSDDYFTKPHLILGVPLASKPLQRPFVGAGIGVFKTPIKFNIFAGVVFIRERVPGTLAEGDVATTGQLEADLRTRWVRKFMFGINLPVGQIKEAIK